MQVLPDQEAFETIKPTSRNVYRKSWEKFKSFDVNHNFENEMPSEDILSSYFKQLRASGAASSSLWTNYSLINAVIKAKYGERLQNYPRLTSLIKSFDTGKQINYSLFKSWLHKISHIVSLIPPPRREPNKIIRCVYIFV